MRAKRHSTAKVRDWRAANPEKAHAAQRAYAERNRERIAAYKHGLAPKTKARRHAFQELEAGRARPAGCDVCGSTNRSGKALHFDHDHKTGAFRGWLCHDCNLALGHTNDDIERLDRLIVYLARSRRPKLAVAQ